MSGYRFINVQPDPKLHNFGIVRYRVVRRSLWQRLLYLGSLLITANESHRLPDYAQAKERFSK